MLGVILILEEGDHLFQVHLVAEESHLDAREVPRHEPLPEGGYFVVPVGPSFFHPPERACKHDLLGRLSCLAERRPFAQLASFPLMFTARRRTCAAMSAAVRAPAAPMGDPWPGPPRPSAHLLVTLWVLLVRGGAGSR